MLHFTGLAQRTCDGLSRRDLLQVGGLAALEIGLPQVLNHAAARAGAAGFGRARSCIVIFLFGGPSQLDTFDLKPDAPAEVRGEFRPIATNVSGIKICEHLPRLARQADKFCLIRSMNHPHPRHGWGLYYMLTGRRHSRPDLDAPPTPEDHPGLGAIVSHLGRRQSPLPLAITLPRWNRFLDLPNDYAGEKAGFLGNTFDPWLVKPGPHGQFFSLDELLLPEEVPPGRLAERQNLLARVDRQIAAWGDQGRHYDAMHRRARSLVSSPAVRSAFDLRREPERLRDCYGRHAFGQGLLLARRLVEAGSMLVQVNWHNDGSDVKSPFWDTHKDNFNSLKNRLLPPLDTSVSALLEDLHARGLLDSTLVVVMGEFGRTPRIGQVVMNGATDRNGRDHWPFAYSVLVAGGGVRGGQVYGATDSRAAHVTDQWVTPPDLHATVLHALGIRPGASLVDRHGRAHSASVGRAITRIFG
jgi:hypothetical protein